MTCDQVLLMVSGGLSFCSVFLFSLHIRGFQPPSHLLASEPSALYLDLLSNFHIWTVCLSTFALVLGMEPRALSMQGKHSTSELYHQAFFYF